MMIAKSSYSGVTSRLQRQILCCGLEAQPSWDDTARRRTGLSPNKKRSAMAPLFVMTTGCSLLPAQRAPSKAQPDQGQQTDTPPYPKGRIDPRLA